MVKTASSLASCWRSCARIRASSTAKRKGLVTKSLAPDSSPRMVSESVLCPVNMMIGALKPFLRRMRTASRPSTSGSPTSMITRSICPALAVCTPLVPLSTAIGSNSSCSASCSTSASRSSESSSTIRILRFVIPRPQERHHPGTAFARNRAFGGKRTSRFATYIYLLTRPLRHSDDLIAVQPPIGAHGAEIRLRLQEIVDCPHETGETGIVRPRLAAYAAQASLYTEAIRDGRRLHEH